MITGSNLSFECVYKLCLYLEFYAKVRKGISVSRSGAYLENRRLLIAAILCFFLIDSRDAVYVAVRFTDSGRNSWLEWSILLGVSDFSKVIIGVSLLYRVIGEFGLSYVKTLNLHAPSRRSHRPQARVDGIY